jgi:hypothetical protein
MATAEKVDVRCKVFPGLFSDEREVMLELSDGQTVSVPISGHCVTTDQDLGENDGVDGLVRLVVIEKNDDYVIIELPQPPVARGPRLKVPSRLVIHSVISVAE